MASGTRLIAFYLPQYHPIPENDEWWGKGFTEWTNVSKALPSFEGHYQPHLPGELGFYDLRIDEIREEQARLAREHGIHGFCYYYYWFNGRRVLEKPLDALLESGTPDFPFCICWANETWSRRWDGSEQDILLKQEHTTESDEKFILDVIPLLKDPRYIRINGAPLLVVYRLGIMPDPNLTARTWRRICTEHGIPNIHLCAVQSFGFKGPMQYGFDSACQFPPHDVSSGTINHEIEDKDAKYSGLIYDYRQIVESELQRTPPDYKYFRGVMPSWDNTPRRGLAGNIFHHSSPEEYELWLRGIVDYTRKHFKGEEQLVFINAWNEWGEGAHLEPDRKHGRAYLEATKRALHGTSDWKILMKLLREQKDIPPALLDDVEAVLTSQDRSLAYFNRMNTLGNTLLSMRDAVKFTELVPLAAIDKTVMDGGKFYIENLNGNRDAADSIIERQYTAYIWGWTFAGGAESAEKSPLIVTLQSITDTDRQYYALCRTRTLRQDVAEAHPQIKPEHILHAGFTLKADFSGVEPGHYMLGALHPTGDTLRQCHFRQTISII